ncbi:MAG: hypothetical protein JEZ14_17615 [Marinilabiliaceae bacterium]|nr:hypothetical protein [Marinilabiliaceae bacterium]
MKKIDLTELGLQEISEKEVRFTDGGLIMTAMLLSSTFWGAAFYGAYMIGYDAAQK